MRERKYRAWHLKETRWVDVQALVLNDEGQIIGYKEAYAAPLMTHPIQEVEVMDWTGLLDKKGKEIYEGDILLVPNYPTESDPMGEPDLCEVVFNSGAFCYRQGSMLESFASLCGPNAAPLEEEEVIANIYEHPELIES